MLHYATSCRMERRTNSMFYGIVFTIYCTVCIVFGQLDESPRIYSLHIRSDIQFRFATTIVTSRVANPANYSQETVFDVTLPTEAFISNFTLEIDGVVYPGIVKDKEEAKKEYERAKKKGRTTGLISQTPRDAGQFKVKISVAALSKITFNLTYHELLKRVKGVYEHIIFVTPGYPVDDLKISIAILESCDITTLSVLPIRPLNQLLTKDEVLTENELAVITRPTSRTAFITYAPTTSDQSDAGVSGQFVVQYDIDRSLDGGDILVVNGYFVHFLAPDVQKAIPKDVLFILDTSGSMSGRKIVQMKEAMYIVLDELLEGDRFNIITFSGTIEVYKPQMIDVTKQDIYNAKTFITGIDANGGTDINTAVLDGIELLKLAKVDDERSPVVVFLTDGHSNAGETNTIRILDNINRANEGEIPVFGLAFGNDADWALIKKIAIQNGGVGRKVYEESDADLQISGFYDELAVTLLNNVTVNYLGDAVEKESLTKAVFKNYFKGSEIVVAGKLTDANASTVDLEVLSNSVEGALVLTVDKDSNCIDISDADNLIDLADFGEITEKTWAYLTIKQILERATGEVNKTASDLMKKRAKELSLQYGFVTPLTSMIVTKPESDDDVIEDGRPTESPTTPPPTTTRHLYSGGGGGGGLGGGGAPTTPPPTTTRHRYSGGGGGGGMGGGGAPTTPPPTTTRHRYSGGGGGLGGGGGGDPHYLIRIKKIEHPICFDVRSEDGEIHNFITDPRNKITINTQIIKGKLGKHGQPKTFIGRISIQMSHHVIVLTPDVIIFDTKVFEWTEEKITHFGGHEFLVSDMGHLLTVQFKFGAQVMIRRHMHHHNNNSDVNYLNIFIKHEDGFSKKSTGLIGQFVNGFKHIYLRKQFLSNGGQTMAKLQIKEGARFPSVNNDVINDSGKPTRHRITAKLVPRSDVIDKGNEMCWMVHKKFEEALYGKHEAFVKRDFINA